MSERLQTQVKPTPAPSTTAALGGLLQSKCACGGSPGLAGACEDCGTKPLALQSGSVEPPRPRSSPRSRPPIRRPPESQAGASAASAADPQAETAQAIPGETAVGLIVEDEAREIGSGQMRKSEFLGELRGAVCAAADDELAAVGRTARGCPYVEHWIGYYRTRGSRHVERALRRYAPEAAGAGAARDYIPLVSERVRRAVAVWARTGQITGVPEEMASLLPGIGLLGRVGGFLSGIGGAISSAVSSVATGIGKVFSGIGGLFFKGLEGKAKEGADPLMIQSQLGSGSPLESGIRAPMETAFGHDFARVRVHTDAKAASLSATLNARAFTVGSDIAFGRGEYQPGTLIGDALLAHELAHVVQQGEAKPAAAPMLMGEAGSNALEEEADQSALGALAAIRMRTQGKAVNPAQNVSPRLKSGLRLSRCKTECPTNIAMTRLHHITLQQSDFFARGYRTGIGAVAEMVVSDPAGRNWDGKAIREQLSPGTNSCGEIQNCTNVYGRAGGELAVFSEGSGSIFKVGEAYSDRVLGINIPARRNTFYDAHIFVSRTSELHQMGLGSCEQHCQQYFECVGGGRIGGSTFQVSRSFARGDIQGTNVTNVEVFKMQLFGSSSQR